MLDPQVLAIVEQQLAELKGGVGVGGG